jgi:hypothetical protein
MAVFRLNLSNRFKERIIIKKQRDRSGQALLPLYFYHKIENALIRKNFFLYLFHHIAAGKTAAAAN